MRTPDALPRGPGRALLRHASRRSPAWTAKRTPLPTRSSIDQDLIPAAEQYLHVPFIEKGKRLEDGSYVVSGRVTDESVDLDQQIADNTWARQALNKWFKRGNIREMHQQSAVGKAVKLDDRGNDGFWIDAKIVDPLAITKCEEGVYTGFSVGIKKGRIVKGAGQPAGGRIVGGDVIEVSLVDYPCNENANLLKAALVDAQQEARLMAASQLVPMTDEEEALRLMVESIAKNAEAESADPAVDAQAIVDAVNQTVDAAKGAAVAAAEAVAQAEGPGAQNDAGQDAQHDGADDDDHIAKLARAVVAKVAGVAEDSDEDIAKWAEADMLTGVEEAYGAAEADIYKRDFSAKERRTAAKTGAAMPDGSFPIHDARDLANAIHLVGHAKDPAAAKAHIIKRAKALGLTSQLPPDWTSGGDAKKAATAYILKRAHDLICPALDGAEVLATYPELVKTPVLSMAVEPETICQGVWDMLCAEVHEDGGTGSCAEDIKNIASAFYHLNEFLDSEAGEGENDAQIMGEEPVSTGVFLAAVADIRKSFAAEHPDLEHIAPTAPSPDEFNAEALADLDPVQRKPADRRAPSRTFYSHEKRDEFLERLRGVHEALGGVLECPAPASKTPAPATNATNADPNAAEAVSTDQSEEKGAALTDADLTKAAEIAAEAVKAAMQDQIDQANATITRLQADIEKLAAEPDPRLAPTRRAVTAAVPDKPDQRDLAKAAAMQELRSRLSEWHEITGMDGRIWATDQLSKLARAA